jgi:phospholipase/carboxylesterase
MLEKEFIPGVEPQASRLLVVLHGLGDSMEGYRWLPELLDLPGLNYLLVNAPDPYFGGYSWYDFAGDPLPGIQRSRRLLTGLLEELSREGIPGEKTALFGFSQGCLMALETGWRYPGRLAGLVGVSGYVHDPEVLLREKSAVAGERAALVTHGRQDTMIPLELVRGQMEQLRRGGLPIEWHELDKSHTIAGEAELRLIRGFLRRVFGFGVPGGD